MLKLFNIQCQYIVTYLAIHTYIYIINFIYYTLKVYDKKKASMIDLIKIFDCPSPQRLNLLLLGSIWLWYAILRYLNSYKVDVSTVLQIRLPHDMRPPPTNRQLIQNVQKFALKMSRLMIPLHIATLFLFHKFKDTVGMDDQWGTLPYYIIHIVPLAQLLLLIFFILRQSEIIKYAVKRLPLIESKSSRLRNVYILLSDSLTSFTRPLIEFLLFTHTLFSDPHTDIDLLLSSLPSFIRIFQCLREYRFIGDLSMLGNTLKYTCNLPNLIFTWYLRVHPEMLSSSQFESFQMIFLLINSTYSYLWDIKMDWNIPSFVSLRKGKNKMIFGTYVYYFAILTNFIIRFWWLWIFLGNYSKFVFFDEELQYLEVLRRAQWVIFKLESEYISTPVSKS